MKKMEPSSPTPRDEDDLKYLQAALLNGSGLAGTGQIIKDYEDALKKCFGAEYCIAVSSGTAAIHAALAVLDIKPGDEVIVPVTAAVMSALPILELGAIPVFVDCEKDSFAIDVDHAEKLVSDKTKAIISVPMWGYPATTKKLQDFCKEKNIPLIVDAAQAIGTITNGKLEGTSGDIGCFSTHEIKLISTGEGGFILTQDEKLANDMRTYTRLGNREESKKKTFGQSFGLNFKLNSLAAALGVSQVKKLPERLRKRKDNAKTWLENLAPHNDLLTPLMLETQNNKPSFYSTIYLLDEKLAAFSSGKVIAEDLAKNDIETDVYKYDFKLLPNYPVFQPLYAQQSDKPVHENFPNATKLLERMLILPTHAAITPDQIQEASQKIIKVLQYHSLKKDICPPSSPKSPFIS